MDHTFFEISVLLSITVGVALIARLLRQPLIIAYIFSGIIAGPFILNIFNSEQVIYDTLAQFGIVLLLFIIGLNLNFNHLKSIGKTSLIAGLGQVIFTASIGTVILLSMGMTLPSALFLAVAITFSSTIVIMKLLSDKHDTETVYGRYTIGLMLVQDVVAVLLIIALGMMSGESSGSNAVVLMGTLLAVIVALYFTSRYVLPKILDKIAHSSELLFLFAIAWCFGIASIVYQLGLSLEIGAIISGIALSSSPYQLEIGSRIKPLRDFFLIVFFIVLGSEMGLHFSADILLPAGIISLFILVGNPLVLYFIFRALKFTRRNSFLAGLTAAQVSEFGFVLLFAGRQAGHVVGNEVAIFTMVALTTIFVSSYLITYGEQVYRFLLPFFNLFGPDKHRQTEYGVHKHEVWLIGYHRIGTKIAEYLKRQKTDFAVIDFNPTTIKSLNNEGIPAYFGDIADVEFLEGVALATGRVVIMTIPSAPDQINLIQFIQRVRKDVLFIGNAYHKRDAELLYAAGAHFVMMPHLWGGVWITDLLQGNNINMEFLANLKKEQASELDSAAA